MAFLSYCRWVTTNKGTIMFRKSALQRGAFLVVGLLSFGVSFADLPAPVATPITVRTAENTAVSIVFVGHDATNGPFTYEVKTQPSHGQLSAVTGDHVTYTPQTGFVGTDSFTYSTTDFVGESGPATVSITVLPKAVAVTSLPMLSDYALAALAGLLAIVGLRRKRTST